MGSGLEPQRRAKVECFTLCRPLRPTPASFDVATSTSSPVRSTSGLATCAGRCSAGQGTLRQPDLRPWVGSRCAGGVLS